MTISIQDQLPLLYTKYTKTSLFLLKMLGISLNSLDTHGFINAYLGDLECELNLEEFKYMYLLFTKDKITDSYNKSLQNNWLYKSHYEVDSDKVMYVFKIPDTYTKEVAYFLKGEYSKFSKLFIKNNFDSNTDLYKILTKNDIYKKKLEQLLNLNVEIDELAELASPPDLSTEIYRFTS